MRTLHRKVVAGAVFQWIEQYLPCQEIEVLYQWVRKAPLGGIATAQASTHACRLGRIPAKNLK